MRSPTLPYVVDSKSGKNPILYCLVDQTRHDLEWETHGFTAETLLDAILTDLETGKLAWPGKNFMNSEDWIRNMKKRNNWYTLNNEGIQDTDFTIAAEDLLLNLASNFLKRNIQMIPYFGEEVKEFGKRFSNVKSYCLLAYQYATYDNFFLSAFALR